MAGKKHYLVYFTGKLVEVDKKTYDNAFNDPFVTMAVEEYGEMTIEKLTEETEDMGFPNR